ncbi:signal peptidase complex catalytic subunit SEC11 [Pyronema domesticum]|uniref:Signal peptidase complex catalytic subunit SEC11 n=1 Tax=Pyronema omphalodes (strain CBS 100304) TaxID=1076935 RepID=U4L8X8_PYROM|nr:signal peptidase complex catalytic subunit SEC11 [Pyronema domesticum]CCX13513.1 Similar to Signal peptidase complex catalytic subunit SEC11; acc. no. D5GNC3 [Pyronema omphalodes CBS 100304]
MDALLDQLGMSELRRLKPRQILGQVLNFMLILASAFMIWKGLSVAADSPSPIVVVLSGSMEPAFQRGDLLFLWNRNLGMNEIAGPPFHENATFKGTQVGEIVVYNVVGKEIPIVHRIVRTHQGKQTPLNLLTKGDNNHADDTELYARNQFYLDREKEVIGSVIGYIPFVGYVTILLSEYPWLKKALLGAMGLLVILQRE